MKIYMAPMEGITGCLYRNTYNRYFKGVDKYFTPFIAPAKGRPLRTRELQDILPENNKGLAVVPQILTNDVNDFIKTAKFLKEYGYTEVNINLGCPSGTVVSKGKGAGLLYDIDRLDAFLYGVYEADIMKVSIKTRIGKLFPEEFEDIINVYMKYPISELIIHPRIQTDYYRNTPNMAVFKSGMCQYLSTGKNADVVHGIQEICYNGDIFDWETYHCLISECPSVSKLMLGRGVIGNPFLPEMIKKAHVGCVPLKSADFDRLKGFHNELLSAYRNSDLGDNNTLFKMKELWLYMGRLFDGNLDAGKYLKKIKKSKNMEEYKIAVNGLMETSRLRVDNKKSMNYNLHIDGDDEDE